MQDLKVSDLVNLMNMFSGKSDSESFFKVGRKYFIRTVTMHVVGRLCGINDKELTLSTASWIADSGRFHNALKEGDFDEIEPFVNDIIVNRSAIIDATEWSHDLPTEQK